MRANPGRVSAVACFIVLLGVACARAADGYAELMARGNAALAQMRFKRAASAFRRARESAPGDDTRAAASYGEGESYSQWGKKRQALASFELAERLQPGATQVIAALVSLYEDPLRSHELLRRSLDRDPDNGWLLVRTGRQELEPGFGGWASALKYFERASALRRSPESCAGRYWAGIGYLSTGRKLDGHRALAELRRLHPGCGYSVLAAHDSGLAMLSDKRFGKLGMPLLRKGCEGVPGLAELPEFEWLSESRLLLAKHCAVLGYYHEAELALGPAASWGEGDAAGQAKHLLGWISYFRGELEQGRRWVEELARSALSLSSFELLMRIHRETGDKAAMDGIIRLVEPQSRLMLESGTARNPELESILARLLSVQDSRHPSAEPHARRAVEARRDPDSLSALGFVLLRQGRFEEAVPPLQEAVSLQPLVSPLVFLYLGDAHAGAGRSAKAAAAWRRGLALDPKLRHLLDRLAGGKPAFGLAARPAKPGAPL